MFKKIKKVIENKIKVKNELQELEYNYEIVKQGATEEFFSHVGKYKIILNKLDYLDKIDPINSEIPILNAEVVALKLRLDEILKVAKNKLTEKKANIEEYKEEQKKGAVI